MKSDEYMLEPGASDGVPEERVATIQPSGACGADGPVVYGRLGL